jgi:hypothetical protein
MTAIVKLMILLTFIATVTLAFTVPGLVLVLLIKGAEVCALWLIFNVFAKICFGKTIVDLFKDI